MGQEEDRRRFEKGREVCEKQPRSIHGAEVGRRRAPSGLLSAQVPPSGVSRP
jgi:hypothetical protein